MPNSSAIDRVVAALSGHGRAVEFKNDGRVEAQCPAHDDKEPSLSIAARADGKGAVLHCYAGCSAIDIVTALGLRMADLFDDDRMRAAWNSRRDYVYPGGRRVHRKPTKGFPQSGNKADNTLFHADQVGDAATVYVPEGEKDVEVIEAVGGTAVCSAMGAGKAHLADWSPLAGKNVIIIADKDKPGRNHAAEIASLLRGVAASIRTVEAKVGKDAADHIAAGLSLDELVDIVVEAEAAVDGAALLDGLLATFKRYVVMPDEHAAVAVTLWTATTHALQAFEFAPRLVVNSPQKRCGKTRLLDIVSGTCHAPLTTVDATVAAIFRSLGGDHPRTLIIDEADAIFGSKKVAEQNEDLRKLLNAGHQRGRPALRCVGPSLVPTEFDTFAMAVLAGIGTMPDTITDRAVNISMRRRTSGETVAQFRSRRDGPKLEGLRERLAAWAASVVDDLKQANPAMPVEDRAADTWEPLVAVAEAAGGDWPMKARSACRALCAVEDDDDDLGTLLLHDIQQIFTDASDSFLPSQMLVNELRRIEESPWGDYELTVSKLAKRLKPFNVKPGHNAAKTVRGYSLETFHDAFRRYLRPHPSNRPNQDADQDEHHQPEETPGRPQGVQDDATGRVADVQDETGESVKHAHQSDISDGWTGPDATPGSHGSGPRQCPCGRPGRVDPATGMCTWCAIKASKQAAS